MRTSWLIPLAALVLAACQAREPQAPGRPGETAAPPPAATAPVPPPPALEPAPRTAAAPACPPASAQPACPTVRKAPVRRVRAVQPARPAAAQRPQRQVYARRELDIPPHGGYRYQDLEDREVERRYAERRYDAERYGHRGRFDDRRPEPRPYAHEAEPRPYHRDHRHDDRYSGGGQAYGEYERREGYAERRPLPPVVRHEHREARLHDGVRRYEQRSYEERSSFRESYREDGGTPGDPCCVARPAEAAGRDANGFLTWPGKVPAIP